MSTLSLLKISDFFADGKKDSSSFEKYKRVFDDKHGFINNLSILDLLFNEGKFTVDYLKTNAFSGNQIF
jgi:hypothetical protein